MMLDDDDDVNVCQLLCRETHLERTAKEDVGLVHVRRLDGEQTLRRLVFHAERESIRVRVRALESINETSNCDEQKQSTIKMFDGRHEQLTWRASWKFQQSHVVCKVDARHVATRRRARQRRDDEREAENQKRPHRRPTPSVYVTSAMNNTRVCCPFPFPFAMLTHGERTHVSFTVLTHSRCSHLHIV